MHQDNKNIKYDLEERTARFSEDILSFNQQVRRNMVNAHIIYQLTRSGTSIGANYCEANGACSKKDFKNKIHYCKKESKETEYWLRMINKSNPEHIKSIMKLRQENHEFTLIFSKILSSMRKSAIPKLKIK